MADLDDLKYISISEMQTDEALEVLRQIRLNRRIPTKVTKTRAKAEPKVSVDQAAELLRILGGKIE